MKTILPYLLFGLFLWFLPESYLWSHTISDYIFNESRLANTARLQIKIVRTLPYLPEKFSILRPGETDVRVELYREGVIRSTKVKEGEIVFPQIDKGRYQVAVGLNPSEYSDADIELIESRGMSVVRERPMFESRPTEVEVKGDMLLAIVIQR